MPGAGLTFTIQRLMDYVGRLWSRNRSSASASILARKCTLIAKNVQILESFIDSMIDAQSQAFDEDDALRVINEVLRSIRLATTAGVKHPDRILNKLDEAASALRRLGIRHSIEMQWNGYDSLEGVIAAATAVGVEGLGAGSADAMAFNSDSTDNQGMQSVPVEVHVWNRGSPDRNRIISNLSSPDYIMKKDYSIDDPLNAILEDLCTRYSFSLCSNIGFYVCRESSHFYTTPALRWLLQWPFTKAIASLPNSSIDGIRGVILYVIADIEPFILLVEHIEPLRGASGIVAHLTCRRDNVDDILEEGLHLAKDTYHYKHLDGAGAQAQLARQRLEPYKCDWCILHGCCPAPTQL